MKILYLYTKIPPYQIPVLKELSQAYNASISVVYWDNDGNAPYNPPLIDNVIFYKKSSYNIRTLKELGDKIQPNLIFISGWQDWDYLRLVMKYKKQNIPVISGFDDIWFGNFRQRIASFFSPFIFRLFFSHAWVSGPRQYEYAKRLGFKEETILYYLYSGDTGTFSEAYKGLFKKTNYYPKTFLFVGRFVNAKSIDVLADAYKIYKNEMKGDWEMICIGKGEHKYMLEDIDGLTIIDHSTQEEIVRLLDKVGVFILPSRFDVSPLVVHEFSSAGLPLILAKSVGNRLMFLIPGFNGYLFNTDDAVDLAKKMMKMSKLSNEKLIEMSENSYLLSRQHNSKYVAASIMSLIEDIP